MEIWFLIGFAYAVIAAMLKTSENNDEYWLEMIACTILGPLCFLWLIASISQDLIYKKRKK